MVRLDKFNYLTRICKWLFIRKVNFIDGFSWEDYFKEAKRVLIVVNHGPFIGPFAWTIALMPRVVDMGAGHLTFSAIAHPVISNIPVFSKMVGFLNKEGKRLTVDDYIDHFNNGDLNLLSVAPEGEFSMYGNGLDIQPFRSPRCIEIALRAKCEIILVIGKGFEVWQKNVYIGKGWQKKIFKTIALKIPFVDKLNEKALENAEKLSIAWISKRIPEFYVYSKIYEPELKVEDLSDDSNIRVSQLWTEADRMRSKMIEMVEELKTYPA